MLEIHIFITQLEEEMPGYTIGQPRVYSKADDGKLVFSIDAFPGTFNTDNKKPMHYSAPVNMCGSFGAARAEIERHLEQARRDFLALWNKQK